MSLGALMQGPLPVTDWEPLERDMLATIDIEKLLAVERATVETGRTTG